MAETVQIYDTTLRDGMQGEGMSLSVDEKVQVAHALDRLGVDLIEAGFLGLEPQGRGAVRAARATSASSTREIAAFGMTRRRDVAAADDAGAAPDGRVVGAGLHARRQDLGAAPREGDEGLARGEPGDDRATRSRSCARRASASSTTPSTSSTPTATTPSTRSRACSAAADAGAETVVAVRHERRVAARRRHAGDRSPSSSALGDARPRRHPHARRRRLRRGQRAARGAARRPPGAGHDERLRRALRQRQPRLDRPRRCSSSWASSASPPSSSRTLTETAHLIDEICNLTPDPNQPYVGRNAFAHKGGMHVAGILADARTFEHIDPAAVGNDRAVLISELSGKGTVAGARRAARRSRSTSTAAVADRRARQGARAPGLPVRGRRRLVRPADPQGDRRRTSRCSGSSRGA